jgi:hypothetical protein
MYISKFIIKYNKLPSSIDKNINFKQLGKWLSMQQNNYKNNKKILKKETIKKQYEKFIKEYSDLFLSNEDIWVSKLEQIKEYINKHRKIPTRTYKNNDIKQLGKWLSHQQYNYEEKHNIMKNETIRKLYENFIKEYIEYFLSNEEMWKSKLIQVKNYINENNKLPSTHDKNNEIKQLSSWLNTQRQNYKKEINIMKNKTIKNLYEEFIKEYIN